MEDIVMKKILVLLMSLVLTAGMILGLSACSIDINTGEGKEPIHIEIDDLGIGNLVQGLEQVDWNDVAEGLSEIKWDEVTDRIEDSIGDLTGTLQGVLTQTGDELGGVIEGITNGESQGISVEDLPQNYEEALGMLKDLMESSGLGDYYEVLLEQLQNNPEWLEALSNAKTSEEAVQIFLQGISGGGASSNEAAEPSVEIKEPATEEESRPMIEVVG